MNKYKHKKVNEALYTEAILFFSNNHIAFYMNFMETLQME